MIALKADTLSSRQMSAREKRTGLATACLITCNEAVVHQGLSADSAPADYVISGMHSNSGWVQMERLKEMEVMTWVAMAWGIWTPA